MPATAAEFGQCNEYFATVDAQFITGKSQLGEHIMVDVGEFHFIQQGLTASDISIALVEFAVAAPLRFIGTPYRLYLIAFKRKGELTLVHGHVAGKRNGEVVFECAFC